jgi:DNA-binding NarL/FixJ family response regulator
MTTILENKIRPLRRRKGDVVATKNESKPLVVCLKKSTDSNCYNCVVALDNCNLEIHTAWNELFANLTHDVQYLAIHIDTIKNSKLGVAEWAHMMSITAHLVEFDVPLTKRVVIRKSTPYHVIQELKKTAVSGILLDIDEFDLDLVKYAMDQCLAKRPYWPDYIIDMLPGNKKVVHFAGTKSQLELTVRQQQILELICNRGLSNKMIGSVLKISENTVKVHVKDIMRIFGVRSRLQLSIVQK